MYFFPRRCTPFRHRALGDGTPVCGLNLWLYLFFIDLRNDLTRAIFPTILLIFFAAFFDRIVCGICILSIFVFIPTCPLILALFLQFGGILQLVVECECEGLDPLVFVVAVTNSHSQPW